MQKIGSFHQFNLNILSILSSMTRLVTSISDHAHSKHFWLTFGLCEFLSKCKKSDYFTDLFWRYGWLKKSCNLIGWEHFGPYLWNKNFAGLDNCRILQRIVQDRANNISFYYRINSVNFSINPKNRFWSIFGPFPQFSGQKKFPEKIRLCRAQLHIGFLHHDKI